MTAPGPQARTTEGPRDTEGMIELRGIQKTYRNAAGEFPVLKGLDLTISRGEFVSIVGKSGSGKSTLLNMITGIDHPTGGQVVIGGMDIYAGVSESRRSKWRGRNLGIVFQFFQLLPMLTLLENVMLPMDYADMYDFEERPERAMELLKMVGLENYARKLPVLVSTGQQQSAAIARALACDPPVMVADEPTGNLDSRSASTIIDLFERLAMQGKTIVMVTHDPSLTSRTTRNIIIFDGELIDEAISRALPSLRHRHMLEMTKKAGRRTYAPGEMILRQGAAVEEFQILANGEAVVLSENGGSEQAAATLEAGSFFGEMEIVKGGTAAASIRAGGKPVEVLTYPARDFKAILDDSPITLRAIEKIIEARLAERIEAGGGRS